MMRTVPVETCNSTCINLFTFVDVLFNICDHVGLYINPQIGQLDNWLTHIVNLRDGPSWIESEKMCNITR